MLAKTMFLSTYEDYQRKQALDNKWPQKLRLQLVAVCGLFINIASEIGPSGLTLEWMGGRGIKHLNVIFPCTASPTKVENQNFSCNCWTSFKFFVAFLWQKCPSETCVIYTRLKFYKIRGEYLQATKRSLVWVENWIVCLRVVKTDWENKNLSPSGTVVHWSVRPTLQYWPRFSQHEATKDTLR